MEFISQDNLFDILIQSDYRDVLSFCAVDTKIAKQCENETLWEKKYIHDFGNPNRKEVKSWYELYTETYFLTTNYTDILNKCDDNTPFNTICNNEYLWNLKYIEDFVNNGTPEQRALSNKYVSSGLKPGQSWKNAYIETILDSDDYLEILPLCDVTDICSDDFWVKKYEQKYGQWHHYPSNKKDTARFHYAQRYYIHLPNKEWRLDNEIKKQNKIAVDFLVDQGVNPKCDKLAYAIKFAENNHPTLLKKLLNTRKQYCKYGLQQIIDLIINIKNPEVFKLVQDYIQTSYYDDIKPRLKYKYTPPAIWTHIAQTGNIPAFEIMISINDPAKTTGPYESEADAVEINSRLSYMYMLFLTQAIQSYNNNPLVLDRFIKHILETARHGALQTDNLDTLIKYANDNGNPKLVAFLNKLKPNINQDLLRSAAIGDVDVINYLVQNGANNFREATSILLKSPNISDSNIIRALNIFINAGFNDYQFIKEEAKRNEKYYIITYYSDYFADPNLLLLAALITENNDKFNDAISKGANNLNEVLLEAVKRNQYGKWYGRKAMELIQLGATNLTEAISYLLDI